MDYGANVQSAGANSIAMILLQLYTATKSTYSTLSASNSGSGKVRIAVLCADALLLIFEVTDYDASYAISNI